LIARLRGARVRVRGPGLDLPTRVAFVAAPVQREVCDRSEQPRITDNRARYFDPGFYCRAFRQRMGIAIGGSEKEEPLLLPGLGVGEQALSIGDCQSGERKGTASTRGGRDRLIYRIGFGSDGSRRLVLRVSLIFCSAVLVRWGGFFCFLGSTGLSAIPTLTG